MNAATLRCGPIESSIPSDAYESGSCTQASQCVELSRCAIPEGGFRRHRRDRKMLCQGDMRVMICSSRTPSAMRHAILLLALLTAASFVLAGCSKSEARWTEDVQLSTGERLVVRRTHRFEVHAELGGPTSAFVLDATLESASGSTSLPTWHAPLEALILDRDPDSSGEFIVIAATDTCPIWAARGRPEPEFWQFRTRAGRWEQVPFDVRWLGKASNLLFTTGWLLEERGDLHVPIDRKRNIAERSGAPWRQRLANADPPCRGRY
jgi:hypothetical protein